MQPTSDQTIPGKRFRPLYTRVVKRGLDIAIGGLALLVLSPLLLAVAVAVAVRDGFPILFRQQRVGRYGRPFTLLKFRTMRDTGDTGGTEFDAGSGARVTALGARLRRWKLDELPQLINVLRGEMSLVGPRPEVREWVAVYPERWRTVLSVRPGITDWASIRFRHEEMLLAATSDPHRAYRDEILPEKLDYAETYAKNVNLLTDLHILMLTLVSLGRR